MEPMPCEPVCVFSQPNAYNLKNEQRNNDNNKLMGYTPVTLVTSVYTGHFPATPGRSLSVGCDDAVVELLQALDSADDVHVSQVEAALIIGVLDDAADRGTDREGDEADQQQNQHVQAQVDPTVCETETRARQSGCCGIRKGYTAWDRQGQPRSKPCGWFTNSRSCENWK